MKYFHVLQSDYWQCMLMVLLHSAEYQQFIYNRCQQATIIYSVLDKFIDFQLSAINILYKSLIRQLATVFKTNYSDFQFFNKNGKKTTKDRYTTSSH